MCSARALWLDCERGAHPPGGGGGDGSCHGCLDPIAAGPHLVISGSVLFRGLAWRTPTGPLFTAMSAGRSDGPSPERPHSAGAFCRYALTIEWHVVGASSRSCLGLGAHPTVSKALALPSAQKPHKRRRSLLKAFFKPYLASCLREARCALWAS